MTPADALATGRGSAATAPLPDGGLLLAGGQGASGALAGLEIVDAGLGHADPWRPRIDRVDASATFPVLLAHGATVTVGGARFRGRSPGGGGTLRSGDAESPIVTLLGPLGSGTEHETRIPARRFASGTELDFVAPSAGAIPGGHYALRVVVNGMPSAARIVRLP